MGSLYWIRMWEPIEPPEPRAARTSLDDMWILVAPRVSLRPQQVSPARAGSRPIRQKPVNGPEINTRGQLVSVQVHRFVAAVEKFNPVFARISGYRMVHDLANDHVSG